MSGTFRQSTGVGKDGSGACQAVGQNRQVRQGIQQTKSPFADDLNRPVQTAVEPMPTTDHGYPVLDQQRQ